MGITIESSWTFMIPFIFVLVLHSLIHTISNHHIQTVNINRSLQRRQRKQQRQFNTTNKAQVPIVAVVFENNGAEYIKTNVLGKGAQGTVIQAANKNNPNDKIAVKQTPLNLHDINEQSIWEKANKIDPKHTIRFLGGYTSKDNQSYIEGMELGGEELFKIVISGHQTHTDLYNLFIKDGNPACTLLTQLYPVINGLNKQNISHNDIKLQNILISTDTDNGRKLPWLKLIDFGMAKDLSNIAADDFNAYGTMMTQSSLQQWYQLIKAKIEHPYGSTDTEVYQKQFQRLFQFFQAHPGVIDKTSLIVLMMHVHLIKHYGLDDFIVKKFMAGDLMKPGIYHLNAKGTDQVIKMKLLEIAMLHDSGDSILNEELYDFFDQVWPYYHEFPTHQDKLEPGVTALIRDYARLDNDLAFDKMVMECKDSM